MKHRAVLLFSSVALLACRTEITSANSGMSAPAAYPTGDAAGVYPVVIAEILKGGAPPKLVVLQDHTTSRERYGTGQGAIIWRGRTKGTAIDSVLLSDVIATNEVSVPLRPDFLRGSRIILVSPAQLQAINERGKVLEQNAIANRRFEMGFWLAFYEAFPGAPGLITLSRVGFSRGHTQAAIDYSISCGDLCAAGGYMILTRIGRDWRVTTNQVEVVS